MRRLKTNLNDPILIKEVDDLEKWFNDRDIPNEFEFRTGECIIDFKRFLDSHFARVKAQLGYNASEPYLKRLQDVKMFLINNLDYKQ